MMKSIAQRSMKYVSQHLMGLTLEMNAFPSLSTYSNAIPSIFLGLKEHQNEMESLMSEYQCVKTVPQPLNSRGKPACKNIVQEKPRYHH